MLFEPASLIHSSIISLFRDTFLSAMWTLDKIFAILLKVLFTRETL